MDVEHEDNSINISGGRFQNILNCLSKHKWNYVNIQEEIKNLREMNSNLEVELRESRELEKSHRYHLLSSREMIGNLQETVSQLMYLKRDVKKLKDDIACKDGTIITAEKDKENILRKHNKAIAELKNSFEKQIEDINVANERKINEVQQESDTQVAQFTCVIEELRAKLRDVEADHREKINVVVLDYEEKIQRSAAQVSQMQDQLARQAARTESNIDAYRRRLEELEEKLKQTQFKQYLAQSSYPAQYESHVERPYSETNAYSDTCSVDLNPVLDMPRTPLSTQNRTPRPTNTLKVMYFDNKNQVPKTAEKKGQFNITKKRKLYSDKDLNEF